MAEKKRKLLTLGERMKNAREKKKISMGDLARETGYSANDLKKVEENKSTPPVSMVLQLSRVLNFNMESIEDDKGKKATQVRTKSHKKRVDSYAYTSLTETCAKKHLRAYLVSIDAATEHKGVEYKHDGEEFIYVLKGGLVIQVGENVTVLSKGESIHFNSGLHHKLSNPTQEETKLLVTIYTP